VPQATPQAQKDDASVQQMLQRLQGNVQQTKQAIAVKQVTDGAVPSHIPPIQPQRSGDNIVKVTSLAAPQEHKGLADHEWDAL